MAIKRDLMEFFAQEVFGSSRKEVREKRFQECLRYFLDNLTDRERFIFNNQYANKTYAEIAPELGVSKERVRQIYLKTLSRIGKMQVNCGRRK